MRKNFAVLQRTGLCFFCFTRILVKKIHQSDGWRQRGINRKAVYTPPAFHPKALRLIIYLAGLLACFLFTAFPSRLKRDSGRSVNSPA